MRTQAACSPSVVVESCKQIFAVAGSTAAVADYDCLGMEPEAAGQGASAEADSVVEPGCTAWVRVVSFVAVAQAERVEVVVVLQSVAA
jgi:hypothetical protein